MSRLHIYVYDRDVPEYTAIIFNALCLSEKAFSCGECVCSLFHPTIKEHKAVGCFNPQLLLVGGLCLPDHVLQFRSTVCGENDEAIKAPTPTWRAVDHASQGS